MNGLADNEIVLIPSFEKKLKSGKFKSHEKIILSLLRKLDIMGRACLKILDVADHYLLCEMKVMKPPYRLYVLADKRNKKFYILEWSHKEKQNKTIGELRLKMFLALKSGFERTFN